jgi:hypothetical protein
MNETNVEATIKELINSASGNAYLRALVDVQGILIGFAKARPDLAEAASLIQSELTILKEKQ